MISTFPRHVILERSRSYEKRCRNQCCVTQLNILPFAGDRQIRVRECEQAAGRQQVRPDQQEGCGLHLGQGVRGPAGHSILRNIREERHKCGTGQHQQKTIQCEVPGLW